ncbi:MAG TPA: ATP-binding cassette domain-containing protein [Planctomycetes bacterium]|nr:ATP-binding cassette domain-containing protein [Planctomycetota bacterium]
MAEIGLRGVTHGYGGPPLLDGVDLHVERGERVALVGRNGAGKSTLLAILAGELTPDAGERVLRPGARVARLGQEVPRDLTGSVRGALEGALAPLGLEHEWELEERIGPALTELGLEGIEDLASLSAGAKRRVLLARALIAEPDVLILDEPTNHIDIEGVLRLETRLARWKGSLLFVTHDRAFLKGVAGRILDLDRGRLRSYECDFATYLARREAELAAEEEDARQFDKKLAKEEAWLRRGIKARRTRNMGRVRALEELRRERAARRERSGGARAVLNDAGRTGQLVLRARGLRVSFGGKAVLDGVDVEIQRGDRVGVVGPNGAGKSTLIATLLGEIEPDEGSVRIGTGVAVGRFDQLHSTLDESKTVQENIVDDGDTVTIGGRSRHVLGYLADFLFSPEAARGPITRLSGGERNRLQLARLLSRPANLLVLDEPTNDLDIETLEVLENLLAEFDGTLLVVSHDREFLNNVVTQTLVFEGGGRVREVVGAVSDWRAVLDEKDGREARLPKKKTGKVREAPAGPRRRTFAEKRELEELPGRIEALEEEKGALETAMADPGFYRRGKDEIAADTARFEELAAQLEFAYARWEELESLAG